MDDHTPDQQTVNHNLQWMAKTTQEISLRCSRSQISYGMMVQHHDGPQKKRKLQELLENHYGFAFMNLFLIAFARHSSAANGLIPVLASLLSSGIASLIQSYHWLSDSRTWLYDFVSQMGVVLSFLCILVPTRQRFFDNCIKGLHKSIPVGFLIGAQRQFGNTAFRQSPDYVIHFIQSQGMRPTVTKVMTGLQNIMQTMKRKHDLSESDFQVAFVESFEKCRTLVHPDDKQISTAQSPHWNNQDHRVTEGSQMNSAVPVPQWDNQDRGITGGTQMDSAVPVPQWDNQDRGITGGSQMNSAVPAPQWYNQDHGMTGGSQMSPGVPAPQWYCQDHGIIGGFQMSPGVPNLFFSMKDIQETSLDYAEDDSSQVAGGSQPRA